MKQQIVNKQSKERTAVGGEARVTAVRSGGAHGEWLVYEDASGGAGLLPEARLKPNDLTQPDTTHYSLAAVRECRYAKYRK